MIKKIKNKIGAIEMDQLGKILIALIALIILIYIVTQVIGGEMTEQGNKITNIFRGLR